MREYTLKERIDLTARFIASGRRPNRTFDSWGEMGDCEQMAAAIYRRVIARPNTKLARNAWRYLDHDYCKAAFERENASLMASK